MYQRLTADEESGEMVNKEARLRAQDHQWMLAADNLESLWRRGLGPRPDWPWGNPPHRGGNPPSVHAEKLKKDTHYDKWMDEQRNEQDAQMKKDRDIFELEAGERVAREHERWIGYHGPTSSQRQSARAAVALYDEKTDNTRQLKEHIHNDV